MTEYRVRLTLRNGMWSWGVGATLEEARSRAWSFLDEGFGPNNKPISEVQSQVDGGVEKVITVEQGAAVVRPDDA